MGPTTARGADGGCAERSREALKAVAAAGPAAALVAAVEGTAGCRTRETIPRLSRAAPTAAPCPRGVTQPPCRCAPGASLGPQAVPTLSLQRPHFSLQCPQPSQHRLQHLCPTGELRGDGGRTGGCSCIPLCPPKCQRQKQQRQPWGHGPVGKGQMAAAQGPPRGHTQDTKTPWGCTQLPSMVSPPQALRAQ